MRDISIKKENKGRTYTNSSLSSTPPIFNVSLPKICQSDQRILTLTLAPRSIFGKLCAQEGGICSYRVLRRITGYDGSSSFAKHMQSLTRAGLVACVGNHKNRLALARVVLCSQGSEKTKRDLKACVRRCPLRETDCHSATCEKRLPEKNFSQEQSATWPGVGAQKRRCLKCRTSFLSHWAGERICPDCKEGSEWRFANCYGSIDLALDALETRHREAHP